MELKDFVRDTLLDIVQGVKEAQDVCSAEGAIISPRDAGIPGSRVNILKEQSKTISEEREKDDSFLYPSNLPISF